MDKKDIEIKINNDLVKKNEELQVIINQMESDQVEKTKSLEILINELEEIKAQWYESLNDLNIQRAEYKKLNQELLVIKKEMNKIKKYL